jgi:hypothetical protein
VALTAASGWNESGYAGVDLAEAREGDAMSAAARSVLVFGVYLVFLGVTLVVAPNLLLTIFTFPPTGEVWIRVAGVLTLCIASYYVMAARHGLAAFFAWTVAVRAGVLAFFVLFAVLRLAQPALVLFGLVDLAGAVWTAVALRSAKAS